MPGPLVAFRVGPISVYWYGIIIVTAVLVASYVAAFEAKRRGENEDHQRLGTPVHFHDACLSFSVGNRMSGR